MVRWDQVTAWRWKASVRLKTNWSGAKPSLVRINPANLPRRPLALQTPVWDGA